MCALLGVVLGFGAVAMVHRLRHHRGGCHGGGPRGFGFGGPRKLFFMMRGLGLDRRQRDEVWSVAQKVRQSMGELRFGRMRGLDIIADTLASETFDRARVEAEAQKQATAFEQLRKDVVDGLERLHAILTPQQRERLRSFFGMSGGEWSPSGGPYR